MTLYALALFLHVLGALGLFAAMSLEWVLVASLRGVDTAEQARDWLSLLGVIRRLSPISMTVLLAAGIYLAATAWGAVPWIVAALVAMLLLPPLGMIDGLRLPKIAEQLAGERGSLAPERREQLGDPLFQASIQVRTAIVLGIVFLMTSKPDAVGSAVEIGAAIVVGVAFSFPALDRARLNRSRPAGQQGDGSARVGRSDS